MAKNLTISFPLKDSSLGYLFNTEQVTSKAIQANLLLLLTTEVGTRWYLPQYGCDLRPILFEQNSDNIEGDIKNIITASVNKFMPEITINEIKYESPDDEPNAKYVNVLYTYSSNAYSESNILSIRFVN
jgi:phage baseplate assembly protein W